MIGLSRGESRLACGENSAISGAFEYAENCGFLLFSGQRCQRPQRLWKVLHRDDLEPVRIAPSLLGILPGRNEEDVHTCFATPARLSLRAAARRDRPVEPELTGRRDLVAVSDVPPELLEDVRRDPGARGG